MKILLTAVNAKYIHSNLAVYSLKAYAQKYPDPPQVEIEIAEYTTNQQIDDILAGIYKSRPDVLCFSCYIWNIRYIEELMREYHKLCPDVPLWAGGPEVSFETEAFLTGHPEVTGVMTGEGEETFLGLCRYYAAGERKPADICKGMDEAFLRGRSQSGDFHGEQAAEEENGIKQPELSEIPGIVYRDGDRVRHTTPRDPLDLNNLPFCYENLEDFKNRIIYYESSRGCPFRCSYCLSSVEKKLRFKDIALVKKELGFFMERKVPQVKFVDRTFNCNHEHAMEIWRFLKEQDNGITNFHFEISADLLTDEELLLLGSLRPGLVQLEIGVQSTNPATIEEIRRTMELPRLKEVVRQIQKGNNIHEHLDLIAGLPFEDYDTFKKSFDEIYALKPNQLQLGFLKVLKGSYLYGHAEEYGIAYHEKPPYEVLKTKWLDYRELLKIRQAEEMLEVYYNSGQYGQTIRLLETRFDSAFEMFLRLGLFYGKKGYDKMSHSRMRRAEILLEFASECSGRASECSSHASEYSGMEGDAFLPAIRESLVYDLYLRENMKSRPAFAPDLAEWKDITREYCKNGKQTHVERFFYRFSDGAGGAADSLPKREEEPVYLLFDYRERDALTNQAACREIIITQGGADDKTDERNS